MINSAVVAAFAPFRRFASAEFFVGRIFRPIDAGNLAYFRIAFGAIMLFEVFRYFEHGWIARYYLRQPYLFTYPGFSWVHPWPEFWMYVHFGAIGVFALLLILGLFTRAAAAGLFLTFSYVFLLDQARYLNHFYLVILLCFLMIFIPANRVFSLDALLRTSRARQKPAKRRGEAAVSVPNWSIWLLQFQVGIVYVYGGIAKLTPDWLRGYPLRDWIADEKQVPFIGAFVGEYWMAIFLSYAGLLIDLLVVSLLLSRRTRGVGVVIALAFNLMNWQLFSIGIFPWVMIFSLPLFFEHDWARRMWDLSRYGAAKCADLAKRREKELAKRVSAKRGLTRKQVASAGLIAIYAAFQLLFPLRHWLYPGVVHWTEEGHNFSWHMKLRSKTGTVTFRVVDPVMGEEYTVEPHEILDERQARKMAARPDMILQFAHFLAEKYDVLGHGKVEVYALSRASLNGRPMQTFIKPDRDLAKVAWSLWPADWIEPLTTPLEIR